MIAVISILFFSFLLQLTHQLDRQSENPYADAESLQQTISDGMVIEGTA